MDLYDVIVNEPGFDAEVQERKKIMMTFDHDFNELRMKNILDTVNAANQLHKVTPLCGIDLMGFRANVTILEALEQLWCDTCGKFEYEVVAAKVNA